MLARLFSGGLSGYFYAKYFACVKSDIGYFRHQGGPALQLAKV
jgi:hypothetical protein